MKVDRRDFLKFAAATGVAIPSWGYVSQAQAQVAGGIYSGKILINVLLDGGICSGWWTDPKNDPAVVSWRTAVGGVTPEPVAARGLRMSPRGNNAAFIQAYQNHMMFIMCDNRTNDHGAGKRVSATGSLGMGFPNVSALFADRFGRGTAFPWLNSGNGDVAVSGGLVAPTPTPNANSLVALANPNAVSTTQDLMKQGDIDKVLAAQLARSQALNSRTDLAPRLNILSKQFIDSGEARATLARVAQFIPAQFNQQFPQAHAGLVAAQAGITTSLQLSTGGFDNHSNTDGALAPANGAMGRATNLIDFIWQTAATMGIDDRLVVRVHSDFGRTPMNNQAGTDHRGEGATNVLMEKNAPWAGRVFGATGPRYQRLLINPTTAQVDPVNGKVITAAHVHAALRNYLGINTTDPRFNLGVPASEMFDFFNPAIQTGYPSP